MEIKNDRAVFIVPTAEFQLKHYKERNFIPYVLDGCKDKKKAFENWMQRDIEFAKEVAKQARLNKRNLIVTDGNNSLKENFYVVEKLFKLI